jgi:hypothetical protein
MHVADIAARLNDWDGAEAMLERQREEYEREQIATAQSEMAAERIQQEYSNG